MRVSFRFTRPVKPGVYFTDVDLPRALQVRDVIFNPPATIVFWEDGMKTVVKCSKDDAYDPERGFELAFLKRVLGGGGALRRLIRDWVEPEKELHMKHKDCVSNTPPRSLYPYARVMYTDVIGKGVVKTEIPVTRAEITTTTYFPDEHGNLEVKRVIISENPQQAFRNHLCACNRLRKEEE